MSEVEQKQEILSALEEWFQTEHPRRARIIENSPEDISMAVKSICAIYLNSAEVIEALDELGLDASWETPNGIKLWQLALMHGRIEIAEHLYDNYQQLIDEQSKVKKKPGKFPK